MPEREQGLNHRQKVKRLLADLHKEGVWPSTVAPPLFKLLWALGWNVPPPLFLGFITLTIFMGTAFGLGFGVAMWLLQWQAGKIPVGVAIIGSALGGLLFGLIMAVYMRRKAASLGLPRSWDDYPDEYTTRSKKSRKGRRPDDSGVILE
jgi:hypothetical protein